MISQSHSPNNSKPEQAAKSSGAEKFTNNAGTDCNHSPSEGFAPVDSGTRWSDIPHNDAKAAVHNHRHGRRDQPDTSLRKGVRGPHREEETGNDHDPVAHYNNDRAAAATDGDTHHCPDEDCNHGSEAGRDGCCSSPRWKDNPHDDMAATETDDGSRSAGPHFAPEIRHQQRERPNEGSLPGTPTSAVHRTLVPLKSELSSFSTAVFKSAEVSNSTNLSSPVSPKTLSPRDRSTNPLPSRPTSE